MWISRALITFTACVSLGALACAERASSPAASSSPASAAAAAAPRPATRSAFDASTLETRRGEVVRLERVASRRRMSSGVHALVRSESGETLAVHLGPSWFLDDQALVLQPGDAIVVSGWRVTIDGAPALLARAVAKGDAELVLRDEAGLPVWRAARGGPPRARPSNTPSSASTLSATERQALRHALDDEYRAWATYHQVIADFGPQRPFIHIRDAEARHIEALRTIFTRYGLEIPENDWPERTPRFASLREACRAGSEAEIANAALYERLMKSTSRADILAVFANLKRASEENHLPAFRRCATREPRPGARR